MDSWVFKTVTLKRKKLRQAWNTCLHMAGSQSSQLRPEDFGFWASLGYMVID